METLWTVKNKKELDSLKDQGFLTGDLSKSQDFWNGHFSGPYQWINNQMKNKIEGYQASAPLWAWTKRPDFRSYRVEIPKGESLFLIKFRKNPKDILVSNFDLWHFVLNGYPLILTDAEEASFKEKYGENISNYWQNKQDLPQETVKAIEATWLKIFKNKEGVNQATFEKLSLNEIIEIKEYKK